MIRTNLANVEGRLLLLSAICLLMAPVCVRGQDSSSSQESAAAAPTAATVELKKDPIEILRELEPRADAPYRLGKGDQITIEVEGRPELGGKYTIGPDGDITLAFAGTVVLYNQTRDEAVATIEKALNPYYEGVTATVRVDQYSANEVTLLGAVQNPGVMQFAGTPLLLEVISRGGMLPDKSINPSGSAAAPTFGSAYPEECIIYRGHNTVFTVELRDLLEEDNDLADYRLMRGDIVYVPGPDKYVAMSGQILHPGTLPLHSTSTLPELIAEAGGPTDTAGRNPTIEVIHPAAGSSRGRIQVIRYSDILQSKPLDLTLQSGDIIFVPESRFNKVAYAVDKLGPLVNLVTLGALLQ